MTESDAVTLLAERQITWPHAKIGSTDTLLAAGVWAAHLAGFTLEQAQAAMRALSDRPHAPTVGEIRMLLEPTISLPAFDSVDGELRRLHAAGHHVYSPPHEQDFSSPEVARYALLEGGWVRWCLAPDSDPTWAGDGVDGLTGSELAKAARVEHAQERGRWHAFVDQVQRERAAAAIAAAATPQLEAGRQLPAGS